MYFQNDFSGNLCEKRCRMTDCHSESLCESFNAFYVTAYRVTSTTCLERRYCAYKWGKKWCFSFLRCWFFSGIFVQPNRWKSHSKNENVFECNWRNVSVFMFGQWFLCNIEFDSNYRWPLYIRVLLFRFRWVFVLFLARRPNNKTRNVCCCLLF